MTPRPAALLALLLVAGGAGAQYHAPVPCPTFLAAKAPSARAAYEKLSPPVAAAFVRFVRAGGPARLGRSPEEFYAQIVLHGEPLAVYAMRNYAALAGDAKAWDAVVADPGRYFAPPRPAGIPWQYMAGAAVLVLLILFRPRGNK